MTLSFTCSVFGRGNRLVYCYKQDWLHFYFHDHSLARKCQVDKIATWHHQLLCKWLTSVILLSISYIYEWHSSNSCCRVSWDLWSYDLLASEINENCSQPGINNEGLLWKALVLSLTYDLLKFSRHSYSFGSLNSVLRPCSVPFKTEGFVKGLLYGKPDSAFTLSISYNSEKEYVCLCSSNSLPLKMPHL
jgi:hypothetical protein